MDAPKLPKDDESEDAMMSFIYENSIQDRAKPKPFFKKNSIDQNSDIWRSRILVAWVFTQLGDALPAALSQPMWATCFTSIG